MRLRVVPNIKKHKKTARTRKIKKSKNRKKCVFAKALPVLLKTKPDVYSELPGNVSPQQLHEIPPTENSSDESNYTNIMKFNLKPCNGSKLYKCDDCHFTTVNLLSFKVHLRIHTGEKPFQCQYCNLFFTHSASRKYHERIHTGEKPFRCDYCSFAAVKWSNYKTHFKVHTRRNVYKCDQCEFSFLKADILKKHQDIHVANKHYKCQHCCYVSVILSNFEIHQQSHYPKQRKNFRRDGCLVKKVKTRRKPNKSRISNRKRKRVLNSAIDYNYNRCETGILGKKIRDTLRRNRPTKVSSSTLNKHSQNPPLLPSVVFAQTRYQPTVYLKQNPVPTNFTYFKCVQCNVIFSEVCRIKGHVKTRIINAKTESNKSLRRQYLPLQSCGSFDNNLKKQNDIFNYKHYQMPECTVNLVPCDSFFMDSYEIKSHEKIVIREAKNELNSKSLSHKLPLEPSSKYNQALPDKSCLSKSKRNFLFNYSYNCAQCNGVFTEVCKIKGHDRVRQIKVEEESNANLSSQNQYLVSRSRLNRSLNSPKSPKPELNMNFKCAQCNGVFTEVCRIKGHKRIRSQPTGKDLKSRFSHRKMPLGPSSHVAQQINGAKPVKICFVKMERLSQRQIETCSTDSIKVKVTCNSPKKDCLKTISSSTQFSESLIMNDIIDLWSDSATHMFEYDIYDLMTIKSDPKGFFNNTGL